MEELKFDKMNVDTDLAEAFLKENESEVEMVKCGDHTKISAQMKKYFNKDPEELGKNLQRFASEMEENAELFVQLEALLRGIPKEDVIIDINLIMQNFRYWSVRNRKHSVIQMDVTANFIKMAKSSPLASLGTVALLATYGVRVKLVCCDSTAAVCYLFVRLCLQVGIDMVVLEHSKDEMTGSGDFRNGCSAVVTEHSDMDSAIDVFLYSNSKHPWKLHRLFVQEGVFERLKKAIVVKSKLKGDIKDTGDMLNAETIAYENKLFAFDFITDRKQMDGKQVIIVEAYRTVKELLTLIQKENPFFLSLWSNDISEANEIAYNINIPILWINDYGIFSGPDVSSQAFYSAYVNMIVSDYVSDEFQSILKNLQNWSKMSIEKRVKKIMNVVEVLKTEKYADVDVSFGNMIEEAVTKSNKFVEIERGRICVGITDFQGVITYLSDDFYIENDLMKVVTSVVYGAGCIWVANLLSSKIKRILELFQEENLPFKEVYEGCFKVSLVPVETISEYESKGSASVFPSTRLVYTSFGTIFAN